jgi:hypothetical protein
MCIKIRASDIVLHTLNRHIHNSKKKEKARDVAQVVERLPRNCEALTSSPELPKQKKETESQKNYLYTSYDWTGSHTAGMTCTRHAQFGGLENFLPGLALKQDLPNLHLPRLCLMPGLQV